MQTWCSCGFRSRLQIIFTNVLDLYFQFKHFDQHKDVNIFREKTIAIHAQVSTHEWT